MPNSSFDRPDAIIYVPGLQRSSGQAVDDVALRIASALNLNSDTAAAEFPLETSYDVAYVAFEHTSLKTRVCTICRSEPEKQPVKIADIYEFRYFDSLTKNYVDRNVLQKSIRLLLSIVLNIPRILRACFRGKQKELLEKIQLIYAISILLLLVAYIGILGIAVWETIQQLPEAQTIQAFGSVSRNTTNQVDSSSGENNTSKALTFAQFIIIMSATIGVFYPNWKQAISEVAVLYVSVIDYLSMGSRHKALSGQFLALLDYVSTREYRNIHIVAYSFGTVVALDNLFPLWQPPVERVRDIHTLATIGCPFDIIRVFWPSYFKERNRISNVPKSWINVYSPLDVLSSNFRDDNHLQDPDAEKAIGSAIDPNIKLMPDKNIVFLMGSPKRKLSFFEMLALTGLEAHFSYWESKYESEQSAFSPVVKEIYDDDYPIS